MEEAHIFCYGIVDSWQDNTAGDWGYINLKSVMQQYESQKKAEKIIVHLHSDGGVVTEGFAIHDYLRSQGKPVEVIIEGMCASIATVIALAGDTVKMTSNSTFFIHNPWGVVGGDAEQMKKYADELVKLESDIAEFYASKTNITKDDALKFMKEETFFTAEEALEKGFITEIAATMKAVALFKPSTIQKKNKMSDKKKTKKSKLMKKIKSIMALLEGQALNVVLQDVNGVELNFADVADGESPAVGDVATVEGSPAEGEYIMPEGQTYVFGNGGALDAINNEDDDDEDDDSEEVARLEGELEAAQTEIAALKAQAKKDKKAMKAIGKELEEIKALAGDFDPGNNKKKKNEGNGEGSGKSRFKFKSVAQ